MAVSLERIHSLYTCFVRQYVPEYSYVLCGNEYPCVQGRTLKCIVSKDAGG